MSKSPNYMSRNGWKPDMIVLHVAEGTFKGTVSWCCNPNSGVSCHFVTGKNGEKEQLVDLDKASWCNGTSTKKGDKYDYRRSTNRLVRERKTNANFYTISIENEGYSYKDGKGALTEKQYQTVLKLCKELIKKYNIPVDREHIVGHYEIAPVEKPNCPGPKFQWDRLMKDLKGEEKPADKPADNKAKGTITVASGTWNVRKGPGVKYAVVRVAKGGEKYSYYGIENGWYKLSDGYISSKGVKSASTKTSTTKPTTTTTKYYKKCAKKYTSIVDALKSIGVNSSFSNRRKIASANGIKGYVGLSSQNVRMLNLLKAGTLKKA